MRLALWTQALNTLREQRGVALALVVASTRGSPGTAGAGMLVFEDGIAAGTMGGGAMERDAIVHMRARLEAGGPSAPQLRVLRHRPTGREDASGLVCGGEQKQVEWVLGGPGDLELLDEAVRSMEADARAWLVLTPEGARIEPCTDPAGPRSIVLEENGTAWRAGIPLRNPHRVAIFGGGHCGAALARQMLRLDYAVSVIEPRPPEALPGELPPPARHIRTPFAAGAAEVPFPEITSAVVMTRALPRDVEALQGILPLPFPFIGLMGSPAKIARIQAALTVAGFDSEQLKSITAPVGLPFDSNTPEEIAVSVSAQLLQLRSPRI